MFTGIIETLAEVTKIEKRKSNAYITIKSKLSNKLKIDQSVAHNGVCLTVVEINNDEFTVIAVDETLQVTNLNNLKVGSKINLERCIKMNGRLDGHLVQGHVDAKGICIKKQENNGSWQFIFSYKATRENLIVEKGSITVNGISLTAFNVSNESFEVVIIPYTYKHTNLHQVEVGDELNLEFDIIGKYIARLQQIK